MGRGMLPLPSPSSSAPVHPFVFIAVFLRVRDPGPIPYVGIFALMGHSGVFF